MTHVEANELIDRIIKDDDDDIVVGPVEPIPGPERWWRFLIATSHYLREVNEGSMSYCEVVGATEALVRSLRDVFCHGLTFRAMAYKRKGRRLTIHIAETKRERERLCRQIWPWYKPISRVGIGFLIEVATPREALGSPYRRHLRSAGAT